ncbi:MAG: hypothetical protein APG11_01756 [Candidatus Methanofastidiosum methylothiophilum]|uniref:Uncharacterized protein n=1 Tax=Candidatus Methanofastidiosum methylothiophilum TaxID=1705564 RepID=A0A150INK6_9EURY|nr:MAG: hypothetical protein APG11_01756 [Candidatus Methanofastidiosum methylthiophilus]
MVGTMNSISKDDIKNKCWYCGKPVTGFDKTLCRDRNTYQKHYCDQKCYLEAQKILEQIDTE